MGVTYILTWLECDLSFTCMYPTARGMPDANPQEGPVQRRLMAVGIIHHEDTQVAS